MKLVLLTGLAALGVAAATAVPAFAQTPTVAPTGVSAAAPAVAPAAVSTARVVRVIDGDTIVTTRGTVRVIGIDTPERGMCGFGPASSKAKRLAPVGATVKLTTSPGNSTDRYGRILRYISYKGTDFGGAQIKAGLAKARYDSRDGYKWHPKQANYVKWDRQYKDIACTTGLTPKPQPPASAYYANCTAVRAAGAAPIRLGDPGYGRHLDRDGDGTGCE